mmetsp:Transcript_13308/g.27034  ORF Transcript_13308/g.27034 Transcript_13308/m.27034 type:complete len:249 (+) Transcript_13308:608-1354(+)
MQAGILDLLDEAEARVEGPVPDSPQPDALEELVAREGGEAHDKEDAEGNGLRYVVEDLAERERATDEDVDREVRPALLDDLGHDLARAAAGDRHRVVAREGHRVDQRGRGGVVGEGETEEGAERVDAQGAHEQVQVIADRLLQAAGGPVDDDGREVLIQVAEDGQAQGRHGHQEDRPDGEVLFDAEGVHHPRPRGAVLRERRPELFRDLQELDAHLVAPDGRHTGEGQDGNRHAEVAEALPDDARGAP